MMEMVSVRDLKRPADLPKTAKNAADTLEFELAFVQMLAMFSAAEPDQATVLQEPSDCDIKGRSSRVVVAENTQSEPYAYARLTQSVLYDEQRDGSVQSAPAAVLAREGAAACDLLHTRAEIEGRSAENASALQMAKNAAGRLADSPDDTKEASFQVTDLLAENRSDVMGSTVSFSPAETRMPALTESKSEFVSQQNKAEQPRHERPNVHLTSTEARADNGESNVAKDGSGNRADSVLQARVIAAELEETTRYGGTVGRGVLMSFAHRRAGFVRFNEQAPFDPERSALADDTLCQDPLEQEPFGTPAISRSDLEVGHAGEGHEKSGLQPASGDRSGPIAKRLHEPRPESSLRRRANAESETAGFSLSNIPRSELHGKRPGRAANPDGRIRDQHRQQIISQIARAIASARDLGKNEVRVHVEPKELGEVWVKVSKDSSGIRAEFRVQNPEVKITLENGMRQLAESLERVGTRLDQATVNLGFGHQGPPNEPSDRRPRKPVRAAFASAANREEGGPHERLPIVFLGGGLDAFA